MEVDLYPEIDLLDFYRGKISLRRLLAFSLELGRDSLVVQELGRREYGEAVRWDDDQYLAAATANSVRDLLYFHSMCRYMDGGKKGEKPKPPEPIHPPGYKIPKPVFTPQAEAMEIMAAWKR